MFSVLFFSQGVLIPRRYPPRDLAGPNEIPGGLEIPDPRGFSYQLEESNGKLTISTSGPDRVSGAEDDFSPG